MANVYPPSPALSACDSLADIEDLDAFLEAQGQLSQWPTPPLADKKHDSVVYEAECETEDEDEAADDELYWIASALTSVASVERESRAVDIELVLGVLLRAESPPEVLAIAYNILKNVASSPEGSPSDVNHPPPDLAVTACLSLATTFTDDKPPGSVYWARDVCKCTWTAHRIEMTVLQFLELPSLHMLAISSPKEVEDALLELCEIADVPTFERKGDSASEPAGDKSSSDHEAATPLRLAISNTSAHWVNGELTPAQSPSVEGHSFLPLL